MIDAQKPDHISLNTLILRLKEGRYVIPDFQREFEWKPWDIRDLMRSIFLDYYIGSLLLWKGKKENFEALSCEAIYGYRGRGNKEYIVLDGQQRLTAMYYAFIAPDKPLPNRANRAIYYIKVDKFMDEMYDEAFNYEWMNRKWTTILETPEIQYEEHLFPMSILGADGWELPNWVQGYHNHWKNKIEHAKVNGNSIDENEARIHAENAQEFSDHLKGITQQYQISYIELDQDLGVDKVCDIFTQINSKGIRLDAFDLINALLKPKGIQLKHMWRDAASRLEFVDTEKMNVYILQVMSILRQAYCSPKYLYFLMPAQEKPVRDPDGTRRKEILVPDKSDFINRWNGAVKALENAIKLLRHPQEYGVISSKYLPYVSILPVFSSINAHIKTLPPPLQLTAQRKLRQWYWASLFTNRYSGSVESTSARDFIDLKIWFEDDLSEPPLIQEFKLRFRNLELRKETKRGTSVYNGLFNLFILNGARDWITGNVYQQDDLDDHHIVPSSWGAKHIHGNLIHSILNRTPLTSKTNREIIGDRLPNAYIPELIDANGRDTVKSILESHFISPAALDILLRDPFIPDDYEQFISERQRTIMDAIENLLIKERLKLSPQLRELDEQLEGVELGLRKMIAAHLDHDVRLIPHHIMQKIDQKIQRASKKNAAFDSDEYQTFIKKLEFSDLRELQDVITNGSLWNSFEQRFRNKETLAFKFGQLAELRNGIRHSRSIDEIVKKEGEAAIMWFNQVLQQG